MATSTADRRNCFRHRQSHYPWPMSDEQIDASVPPTGDGCVECLASGGWWLHLRRCAKCGHIGCCDTSPSQHATKHNQRAGHPVIASFEPGENWFYDYRSEEFI